MAGNACNSAIAQAFKAFKALVSGTALEYVFLVVATGIQLNHHLIDGMTPELAGQHGISSIHLLAYLRGYQVTRHHSRLATFVIALIILQPLVF